MAQINAKASRPNRGITKHPNNQNISTTLGFGEVTSLGFVEMQGKTKVKGTIKSIIRTATMPVPTFGTISYKQYARFIPTTDIFRNNENLKTELPITTQFGTFIPKNQPYILSNYISAFLLANYTQMAVYKATDLVTPSATYKTIKYTKCVYTTATTAEEALLLNIVDNRLNPTGAQNYKNPLEYVEDSERGINIPRNEKITPQNCDFTIVRTDEDKINQTLSDFKDIVGANAYFFCFRLTKKGKTLYRILTSLGWKFSLRNDEKVNILPLMAYYKGYFELFEPKNTATGANVYTNTNTFRLSDYICEHDVQNVYEVNITGEGTEYSQQTRLFINMLDELAESYYYNEPNLVTAHIATPSVGTQNTVIKNASMYASLGEISSINTEANGQPYPESSNAKQITAPSLKLLMKMYVISNKHSVIGGNIRKLIQSLYGYDPDTIEGIVYDCGRTSYDLDITMIPSQADTLNENGGAQLGEIGGLATGRSKDNNKNKNLQYSCKADTDGYLIFYAVIVPNCGFYQGQDPRLKHGTNGKYSLYNEDFDSIGLEISTKSIVLAERLNEIPEIRSNGVIVSNETRQENTGFGFIPRFMDYKALTGDIVNGDLRRNQYKEQLRPYYLGKELSTPSVYSELDNENKYTIVVGAPDDVPIATPELRSVGKYNWLENFNKIFYQYKEQLRSTENPQTGFTTEWEETFGYDDAFIIHNENKYDKFDHMKPTTESFETDGEESNAITVEHA